MEIGGIKIGIPTFRAKIDNKNKPLANLNEPVQDTFESSTNKKYNALIYGDIYEMGSDIGDKKFSKKVKMAISKLPSNAYPTKFEQNKFEPLKEFSLICAKRGMENPEMVVNLVKPVGDIYSFDAKTTDMISKTHREVKETKDNKTAIVITQTEDFRTNTVITKKESFDYKKSEFILEEQTVVKNDKNGKMLRKETMTPSQVKGMYDITYTYANGTTKEVAKSTVDEKTGIKTIKKDMKSDDGTRTQFLYEDDPQGNRIIDYKVTDKDGKVLMKNSQSFEVLDDNHFISSKDHRKYEIKTEGKTLSVKDLYTQKEASIDFNKKCLWRRNTVVNALKKVPGDELFETVYSISHFQGIKDSMNSCFTPMSKGVKVGDDMFVFLHELGHAKDHQTQKGFFELLKDKRYSDNKDIQETYLKEREAFNKYHSNEEREHVSYFTKAKGHYNGALGGLMEIVAETNALTKTYTDEKIQSLSPRTHYLQQYFPKTISAICNEMNLRDEIDAIEYYGT